MQHYSKLYKTCTTDFWNQSMLTAVSCVSMSKHTHTVPSTHLFNSYPSLFCITLHQSLKAVASTIFFN